MLIDAPKIDMRNQQKIAEQVRQLALQYCPEMASIEKDQQANALIQIFSRMMEIIILRLNKVPDKNFLTFMDLVGVRLSEPRIARAPLTFTMAKKAKEYGIIPAGTQVAAEIKDEKAVIFETEKDLTVISPKLVKAVSLSPNNDKWTDHSPSLFDKEKEVIEELFKGKNLVPHRICLGHGKLFNFKETATIVLDIGPGIATYSSRDVKWYYYKADSPDPIPLHAENINGLIIFNDVSGISEKTLVGINNETGKQQSWTSNWIFGELNIPLPRDNLPEITTIKASVKIAPVSSAGTGTISSDGTSVKGEKTVFTKELKIGDFIIAAGQSRIINDISNDISLTVYSNFDPLLPPGTKFTYAPAGTGTISSAGTTVKGDKTAFAEEFKIGDSITAANQTRIIKEIYHESLTVDSAFDPLLPPGTKFTCGPLGTGTISSDGITVLGERTIFTKELKIGDSITAANQTRIIESIKSDTQLTIDFAFKPLVISGTKFTCGPLGTGTISSTGTTVKGDKTAFAKELKIGDSIMAANQTRIIKEIYETLTVDSAFDPLLPPGTHYSYKSPPPVDMAFFNNIPIDLTKDFNPFGEKPKFNDTFYFGSKEVFSKEKSNVLINIILSSGTEPNTKDITLSWEFWDGKRWIELGKSWKRKQGDTFQTGKVGLEGAEFNDTTGALTKNGLVTFKCPKIEALEINGEENCWIRIRIVGGNYGIEAKHEPPVIYDGTVKITSSEKKVTGDVGAAFLDKLNRGDSIIASGQTRFIDNINSDTELEIDKPFNPALNALGVAFSYSKSWVYKPATYNPPSISTLTLSYRFEPPSENLEVVLTYNDFVYQDKTNKSSYYPFLHPVVDRPSLYLAFDQNIATLPVTIFFPLLEKSAGAKMTPVSLIGTGTISSEKMHVSGNNTIFSRELKKGDYIAAAGQTRTVTAILSDKDLTVDSDFDPPLHDRAFSYFIFPSFVWEYWNGKEWKELRIDEDNTKNLTKRERMQFLAPSDLEKIQCFKFEKEFEIEKEYYWIRANLEKGNFVDFPRLKKIYTNTVWAQNILTVKDEILTSNSGKPGQVLKLIHSPVLSGQKVLVMEASLNEEEKQSIIKSDGNDAVKEILDEAGNITGFWVLWNEVDNFYASDPNSRHYVIDRNRGEITFGDGERGMIPPAGKDNIKCSYKSGGGARGNKAGTGKITKLRTTFPYIDSVTNNDAADGGGDEEKILHMRERGPQTIKHRDRAVTYEDYEWLIRESSPKVAKVKCLPTKDTSRQFKPGWVTLIIVPESEDPKPFPTQQLISMIEKYLFERTSTSLITDIPQVNLIGPKYIQVWIEASVVYTSIPEAKTIEGRIIEKINRFFHPLYGGPDNKGWDFGRNVHISEVYEAIENTEGVDYVVDLKLNASMQIYKLTFIRDIDSFLNSKNNIVTLKSNDGSIEGSITFFIAERVQEEGEDLLTVTGFKEEDIVILSNGSINKSYIVKSISHTDTSGDVSDIMDLEPLTTGDEYPIDSLAGSVIERNDHRIRSFIVQVMATTSSKSIISLKVALFSTNDEIVLCQKDDSSTAESGKIGRISNRVDTIFVEDNYLIYSGTNRIYAGTQEKSEKKNDRSLYPFLINTNSMELHNLNNVHPNCQLDEILEKHQRYVSTLDGIDFNVYDYCAWCFGRKMSKW